MSREQIQIVDYGLGNISSLINMTRLVGGKAEAISDPSQIKPLGKIIIPGVGAFDHGMSLLNEHGWVEPLKDLVMNHKVPVLGICLGMQLMCRKSEEGALPGLGWIDADVRRFDVEASSPIKVPHMGWNTVNITKENPLIYEERKEQRFYFVHSYHVVFNDVDDTFVISNHGYDFVAGFWRENIFGTQFHPEKSHKFGINLMKNFVAL